MFILSDANAIPKLLLSIDFETGKKNKWNDMEMEKTEDGKKRENPFHLTNGKAIIP